MPKHEILPEAEVKALLSRFKVEPRQLPAINITDPVVKVLGAKAGDILKITRESRTAGKAIAYRVVVG